MTIFHRYVLDDATTISLSELVASMRTFDDSYRMDGESLFRGDCDCAIQIDISKRGSEVFDDDMLLITGFASKRYDRDAIVSRLNRGDCMVTMQVGCFSDESAIKHVFQVLNRFHSGLSVYEGGVFENVD